MDNCESNFQNRPLILFLTHKKYRFLRHSLFLIAFFILLSQGSYLNKYNDQDQLPVLLSIFTFFVLMFYINMYFLIPKFLLQGRYLIYFLALFIVDIVGLYLLASFIKSYPFVSEFSSKIPNSEVFFFDGVFFSTMLISASTTVKLFQRWSIDVERIAELHRISLNLELDALKNQINPHFLFNMLNNIKSLTRKDPELASTVIIKLSGFLRHQIYETNDTNVLLRTEIEFLINFLDLEKIRRDNFTTHLDIHQVGRRSADQIFIPANLFTTFVENAVKHSADMDGAPSFINISLILEDKSIIFTCHNSTYADNTATLNKTGGLGLSNIKRRLELLYNTRYTLQITQTSTAYTITLNIPL